jgi:hypothetical protein
MVPVAAEFRVTGFAEGMRWQSPDDLEAARSLLTARYDLKIGIWDLVRNPMLRRTLLDSAPTDPVPTTVSRVPTAAVQRADVIVATKSDQRRQESLAIAELKRRANTLKKVGWSEGRTNFNFMELALTRPLRRWPVRDGMPSEEPFPLVRLSMVIAKRHATVSVISSMASYVDLQKYVAARRLSLEALAKPYATRLDAMWSVLWRSDGGWADNVEWTTRFADVAATTAPWRSVLADYVAECLEVRYKRFQQT